MSNKIKCPKSGEFVDVEDLTSPFIFSKEDLETTIKEGRDYKGLFQGMLDDINKIGGTRYNTLKWEAE